MNVKQNLKYQSTDKAIIDALLDMLKEMELRQVTVAELCRRVEINRATFYLHYQDVPDALKKTEAAVNSKLTGLIPARRPEREDFVRLFCHVKENRAFYSLYFKRGLPLSIECALFPAAPPKDAAGGINEHGSLTPVRLEYHHAMFRAALNALLRCWLEHGCTEPPEQLYDILCSEYPVKTELPGLAN